MNKKYLIGAVIGICVIAVISYVFVWHKPSTEPTNKLQVISSFYPLYFFASQIGGDKAEVMNITPAGAEPHDYEPTAQDTAQIESAKLLILNGGGLEAWGDKIRQNINPTKTTIIVAGEGLTTQKIEEEGEIIVDPHVWLSPSLAKLMVDKIEAGFEKVDPLNATYYQSNAESLRSKLGDLDVEYQQGLSNCEDKNIITSHSAFGYLATSYSLHQVPIAGLSPDAEPSVQQLVDITKFARDNNVMYIFFEDLVSPKLSQTIANEIGAQTLVLHPIEGLSNQDIASGESYLTQMHENLTNLKTALRCTP